MYSYNNKDWIELSADSNSGVGSFTLTNTYVGNIYFKAYDMVRNESETIDYQVKIDKIAPSGTISIQSTDNRYNSLNVKVNLSATDNEKGSGVSKMCIHESTDVNSCSWENYKTSKNMTLSGSLDGKSRTLYAWYKDSVGNISNISDESNRTSYTTVIYPNGFGACSVSCGGGLKTNEARDKYTNKKIPEKNKYESCNNQGCCTSTTITGYGTCSKTCDGGVKQVYRKSNYNNQNCTNSSEKIACNTQSCSITLYENNKITTNLFSNWITTDGFTYYNGKFSCSGTSYWFYQGPSQNEWSGGCSLTTGSMIDLTPYSKISWTFDIIKPAETRNPLPTDTRIELLANNHLNYWMHGSKRGYTGAGDCGLFGATNTTAVYGSNYWQNPPIKPQTNSYTYHNVRGTGSTSTITATLNVSSLSGSYYVGYVGGSKSLSGEVTVVLKKITIE